MKNNSAKLFICHHPDQLLLYKNLVQIIRKRDKDVQIVLFKVNHPYFLKFNFKPYEIYFDKIIEFDFINYKKNFLLSFLEIFSFQRKIKKTIANFLVNFRTIDLFLNYSAWLPINIMLYNLSKQKNIKNITKFTSINVECSQTKTDDIKTFLCKLYSLFFKCYEVKVISTLTGKFQNFAYNVSTPGRIVKIVSPITWQEDSSKREKENILPYPIIFENQKIIKKDMVIIFGNVNIFQYYSEYLPDYENFIKKLSVFLKIFENKYSNCKLYYKPHPANGDKIMHGINFKKYNLFDNTVNAESLFDFYHKKIKAVYSFSSSSVILGSFFGIPSYTFYKYICNQAGIEMFDNFFDQANPESKFLFHIANSREIGKIDNLKQQNITNSKIFKNRYYQLLNI